MYLSKMQPWETEPYTTAGLPVVNVSSEMSVVIPAIFKQHFGTRYDNVLAYFQQQQPLLCEAIQHIGVKCRYRPVPSKGDSEEECGVKELDVHLEDWLTTRSVRVLRKYGKLAYLARVIASGWPDGHIEALLSDEPLVSLNDTLQATEAVNVRLWPKGRTGLYLHRAELATFPRSALDKVIDQPFSLRELVFYLGMSGRDLRQRVMQEIREYIHTAAAMQANYDNPALGTQYAWDYIGQVPENHKIHAVHILADYGAPPTTFLEAAAIHLAESLAIIRLGLWNAGE